MSSGRFGNPSKKSSKSSNSSNHPYISNVRKKAINLEEKRKAMFEARKEANNPSSAYGWFPWSSKGGRHTRRAHKNKKRTNKSRCHRQ